MPHHLPLSPGQRGEPIRDLQRRLAAAGFPAPSAEAGRFCDHTRAAVEAFQASRGLRANGVCDEHTWSALVEATWRLGERLLVLTAPNLRGDDVAELQSLLGRLGFDCGRVDGIFGPATVRAVEDFQRNSGLHIDGICGSTTIRALHLLSRQTGTGPGVAAVRELESLTAGARSLHDLRVVIGQFGGLSALTRQITHGLRHRGAIVTSTDEPDASAQASVANRYAATVYVGFEASTDERSTIWYYAVPSFESVGGRSVARHVARVFDERLPVIPVRVAGVRLTVLRETRMPAIVCTLGPIQSVIDAIPTIAASVVDGLAAWAASPLSPEGEHRSATPT